MPSLIQKRDNFPCWLSGVQINGQEWAVTLGGPVLALAAMLTEKRLARNKAAGVFNHKQGPRPDFDYHFEGLCAEFAFGCLIGIAPDLGTQPRKGGEDFLLEGLTVDVKACPGDYMNVDRRKAEEGRACDLYVAMAGPFESPDVRGGETFSYAGHATHEFVFSPRWRKISRETKEPYQGVPLGYLTKDRDYIKSLSGG